MAAPRLIAIDMDGTLLGSNGRVSPRNLAALLEAEAAGVEVVIATGRRHGYAMGVLRNLGLRSTSFLISSNGTITRTHSADLIHRHQMPIATARWLCSHAAEFRTSLVFTFDTITLDGLEESGALLMERRNDLQKNIGRWMEANRHAIRTVEDIHRAFQEDSGENTPIQAMLCGSVARMREAEARLLEHPGVTPVGSAASHPAAELTLHRTEYPDRDLCIVDILPAGCSKATALARLAKTREIDPADILAIGDNWNDLPMLEFAGQPIVMANAPEDFRAFARSRGWTIGPSNDEDGVACAIEAALQTGAEALPD